MKVAIIFGGYSPEWVISEKSAQVVFKHLNSEQYQCTLIQVSTEGWFAKTEDGRSLPVNRDNLTYVDNGTQVGFDVVFNAIHGTPGEDGKLQGYLDMIGMPATSCDVLPSALTFNKAFCNGFLRQYADVHIADSVIIYREQPYDADSIQARIGLPCFVKPSCAGSSFGISKVKRPEELIPAIDHAFEHDREVIIEQYVEGTEVSCGVYQENGITVALAGTEIVTENEFFDYQAKYEGASREITPPRVAKDVIQTIRDTTARVYDRLGLRGMARIDFIVKGKSPYLIEVNTVPGLSEQSILPQQVRHAGMTLGEFFALLVEEALRHSRKAQ